MRESNATHPAAALALIVSGAPAAVRLRLDPPPRALPPSAVAEPSPPSRSENATFVAVSIIACSFAAFSELRGLSPLQSLQRLSRPSVVEAIAANWPIVDTPCSCSRATYRAPTPGIWLMGSLAASSPSDLRRFDHILPTCTVSGAERSSARAKPSGATVAVMTTVKLP